MHSQRGSENKTRCGAIFTPFDVTTDRAKVTCAGCLGALDLYESEED